MITKIFFCEIFLGNNKNTMDPVDDDINQRRVDYITKILKHFGVENAEGTASNSFVLDADNIDYILQTIVAKIPEPAGAAAAGVATSDGKRKSIRKKGNSRMKRISSKSRRNARMKKISRRKK